MKRNGLSPCERQWQEKSEYLRGEAVKLQCCGSPDARPYIFVRRISRENVLAIPGKSLREIGNRPLHILKVPWDRKLYRKRLRQEKALLAAREGG